VCVCERERERDKRIERGRERVRERGIDKVVERGRGRERGGGGNLSKTMREYFFSVTRPIVSGRKKKNKIVKKTKKKSCRRIETYFMTKQQYSTHIHPRIYTHTNIPIITHKRILL